jgi:hypothetical protein
VALATLPDTTFKTSEPIGPVSSQGEALVIPHRIYLPPPGEVDLRGLHGAVVACVHTRNQDGRVRERFLRRLLQSPEPWVPPFVVQLIGEYVIEIIDVVAARKELLASPSYVQFASENAGFLALTRQRVTSYWNCYYRHQWPRLVDYVPLQLIDSLIDPSVG